MAASNRVRLFRLNHDNLFRGLFDVTAITHATRPPLVLPENSKSTDILINRISIRYTRYLGSTRRMVPSHVAG